MRMSLGAKATRSRSSRMLSMPRLLAASISTRSRAEPLAMASHEVQRLQGSPCSRFAQFTARARIRAVVVFPVPRGPLKRYACTTCPDASAFRSVVTM